MIRYYVPESADRRKQFQAAVEDASAGKPVEYHSHDAEEPCFAVLGTVKDRRPYYCWREAPRE